MAFVSSSYTQVAGDLGHVNSGTSSTIGLHRVNGSIPSFSSWPLVRLYGLVRCDRRPRGDSEDRESIPVKMPGDDRPHERHTFVTVHNAYHVVVVLTQIYH